jgi:hypothetical protein
MYRDHLSGKLGMEPSAINGSSVPGLNSTLVWYIGFTIGAQFKSMASYIF